MIDEVYRRHFAALGSGGVRPEQRAVIQALLDGKDTLSLMPTGGGKSLCYWIAGLALGGTTLAVFPLTALMDEQAEKLRSFGLRVLTLHSGIDWKKQSKALIDFSNGEHVDFILVSPERLATDGLLEEAIRTARDRVKLFVIDEIHCISQWGVDFRPFYKEFPYFIQAVWGDVPARPVLLGLTATLNQRDTEEICQDFGIPPENVLRSRYLLRQGIHLSVVRVSDEKEKDDLVWALLEQHRNEKVLVYVENRFSGGRSTEGMCATALDRGFAAAYFHSGVDSKHKAEIIQRFKRGEVRTVFATSAFGMGIDIPDIRGVVHYRPPESIEQYYQQLGRVGRDQKPAWATIYYSDKNIEFHKRYFIDKGLPTEDSLVGAFTSIFSGRGEVKTLNYFEDEGAQSSYHYLLRSQALRLVCKGASSLKGYEKAARVVLPDFDRYVAASASQGLVIVARKCEESPRVIMRNIYIWQLARKLQQVATPDRCLVVERLVDELPEPLVTTALAEAEEIRQFKYGQLDRLKDLLDGYSDSAGLHQAIGRHLGIDEFHLGRVHETLSGTWVRSKSEVIIANLLWERQIPFDYEASLSAEGKTFSPDFTIRLHGRTYYWEHLGRMDTEEYAAQWAVKQAWYERNFPGQLRTTLESPLLSRTAEALIDSLNASAP